MQHAINLPELDLRLFDEAAQATEGAAAPAETVTGGGGSRRSGTGEANVVYGIGEDAPAETQAAPDAGEQEGQPAAPDTLEERRKAFDALISGAYRDVFAEKFQKVFDRRFKEVKGLERDLAEQKPILELLMKRYSITDGDLGKLRSAVERDDSALKEAARASGMSVEQYRSMQQLQQEVAELKQANVRSEGRQRAQQQMAAWAREGQHVKELYPSFDFRTEADNRDFMGLLRAGIGVQMAYELIHMDEIKKAAARNAGEQVQARIRSNAARPAENGTSTQGAVIVKNDVHNLSRADRAEIARRVQRGERIRF